MTTDLFLASCYEDDMLLFFLRSLSILSVRLSTTLCGGLKGRFFLPIKGTVARDFLPLVYFSWIDSMWAPDSHPNIFSHGVKTTKVKIFSST